VTTSSKPVARVEAHLEKLRKAGLDTQAFFAALVDIRDDSALSQPHREAIYQAIAMESFIWYLEAINGSPMDRAKAAELVAELAPSAEDTLPPGDYPEQEITVRQRPPEEPVARKPKKGPTPKPGVTKFDRPPKK
jgi:hypothetical protein